MVARAFSEREKEMIKKALMEKGRQLFSRYGLKKTSIGDLTQEAGIAQGSFYLFFASKEELYFEILEEEEKKLHEHFLEGLFREGISGKVLKQFIRKSFKAVEENPILRRLFLHDEYRLLLRKLPPEKLQAHINKDTTALLPLILEGQRQGVIISKKPEVITGTLRALFTITLHRKEIGEDVYEETADLMIELISEGLIRKGDGASD